MKLRCTENSIRLRLRKSELQTLSEKNNIEETINFMAGTKFIFQLSIAAHLENVEAVFQHQVLKISIPDLQAYNWIESNQVGIEVHQELPENKKLHILIEKDFPCTDREDEDKSDTFWELAQDKPEVC